MGEKKFVEQVNLYQNKAGWVTCAWVIVDQAGHADSRTYIKERTFHKSFMEAVDFISTEYMGAPWITGF